MSLSLFRFVERCDRPYVSSSTVLLTAGSHPSQYNKRFHRLEGISTPRTT